MIYYRVICQEHGWESPGLFTTRAAAIRSARAYTARTPGPHGILILEVYIAKENLEVRNQQPLV